MLLKKLLLGNVENLLAEHGPRPHPRLSLRPPDATAAPSTPSSPPCLAVVFDGGVCPVHVMFQSLVIELRPPLDRDGSGQCGPPFQYPLNSIRKEKAAVIIFPGLHELRKRLLSTQFFWIGQGMEFCYSNLGTTKFGGSCEPTSGRANRWRRVSAWNPRPTFLHALTAFLALFLHILYPVIATPWILDQTESDMLFYCFGTCYRRQTSKPHKIRCGLTPRMRAGP